MLKIKILLNIGKNFVETRIKNKFLAWTNVKSTNIFYEDKQFGKISEVKNKDYKNYCTYCMTKSWFLKHPPECRYVDKSVYM